MTISYDVMPIQRGFAWRCPLAGAISIAILCGMSVPARAQLTPAPPVQSATGVQISPASPTIEKPTAAWLTRNDPAHAQAVAQQFLEDLSVIDPVKPTNIVTRPASCIRLVGLRPQLVEVETDYAQKKYSDGLDAFYAYFLHKMNNLADYGIDPGPVDGSYLSQFISVNGDGPTKSADIIASADKLMQGVITLSGHDVTIGPPGTVNWNYPFAYGQPVPYDATVEPGLYSGAAFAPLFDAYIITRDPKYIKRWVDYMDDWSLNETYGAAVHPCIIGDQLHNQGTIETINFAGRLNALATVATQASAKDLLPARVFAQMTYKYLHEFLLPSIVYLRTNTHNWTPSSRHLLCSFLFDEFRSSQVNARADLRRSIEDNAVTQNLLDGSENQQDPWYNINYPKAMAEAIDMVERRESVYLWQEPGALAWEKEIGDYLKIHGTYQVHLRTPINEWPSVCAASDKRIADIPPYDQYPGVYDDPVNVEILRAVSDPASGVTPPYKSEWFPYGGYNIARAGWTPDSACGSLFCSPEPGAYGGYRSRSNNNMFGLEAFGQDLLIDDSDGHYMYPSSPIEVDGHNQFFHAGVYKVGDPAGHKVYEVSAWLKPSNFRWESSDNFSLMEGVYKGPYADPPKASTVAGPYGVDDSKSRTLPLDQTIQGITHQRLVTLVRGSGLWIVTDRMLAGGTHQYLQKWQIPVPPSSHPAFDPASIHMDAQKRDIWTDQADSPTGKGKTSKANLSMYQFTSADLTYTDKVTVLDGRRYGLNREEVEVHFGGAGNQQVVTLIAPRAPGVGPETVVQSVEQLTSGKQGVGFNAVLPGGGNVAYVASPLAGGDALTLGAVHAVAGSLLIAGAHGMALDCTSIGVGGAMSPAERADFEFTLNDGKITDIVPIYRPIEPVIIGPEQDVFTDSLTVTLSSPTPGIEFHYTTDGSEPTPQSALYTGPFSIDTSCVVKARGYRQGVTTNPVQTSGTEATPISYAVFNKVTADAAVGTPHTSPGLNVSYWESGWQDLWLNLDRLSPAATGTASGLWDFGIIPASNTAVFDGKATPRARDYALQYSGFLTVPSDGVYVIHAPHEFVWPDVQSGYELQLYIDNKEWYPATRLHCLGDWSIALAKGAHSFRVVWIDFRTDSAKYVNLPGIKDYVWTGVAPDLEIQGPGMDGPTPIPARWLGH